MRWARDDRAARVLHGIVALAALTGFAIELGSVITGPAAPAPNHTERLIRMLSYFTIDSNLLVGIVCLLLVLRPRLDGPVFRPLRLAGVLCIAVTGIVYNTVLTGLRDLTPSGAIANALLHQVAPLVAVIGWLLVGPRPRIEWRTVAWSCVLPLAWLVYTFVRGAAVDWYPYPFLDVTELGLAHAIVNAAIVAIIFLALASGMRWADRALRPAPLD